MEDLQALVEGWVAQAASKALGRVVVDPMLRAAKDASHGDFQANLALALAKELGRSPQEIAHEVSRELLQLADARAGLSHVEVKGPGFLNLTLSASLLEQRLAELRRDPRLGVAPSSTPQTVVVDYSSPNLAKEMHVGHLRSTIIGDAICRVLAFHGDTVIRQNHLGDWGTQFGMLLEYLAEVGFGEGRTSIRDLDELYRAAKQRFDADPDFTDRARLRVVALQSGDEQARALWQRLIDESIAHMKAIYGRLGVLLVDADIRPESFYNPLLPKVVEDLTLTGLLQEDQGAQVVFPEGMQNKEGERMPMFVQKSDGGYGYATTDLAAVRYRVTELRATRVIYVVDSRQADHFKMLFWTVRAAGWASATVSLEHVPFGTILGADRKPYRTRVGGTAKLAELLDEAEARAERAILEKNPDLDPEERRSIAHAVGIGAVKYADLSSERIKDYTFDPERMLAFEGNTAPYLQYAYVRIQSIFRKGEVDTSELETVSPEVQHPTERALALALLRLPRVIDQVVHTLEPHRLCNYLYEVASLFHAFHHSCRVLNAEPRATQQSRLLLCWLTGRTLASGLELLGIRAIERM